MDPSMSQQLQQQLTDKVCNNITAPSIIQYY